MSEGLVFCMKLWFWSWRGLKVGVEISDIYIFFEIIIVMNWMVKLFRYLVSYVWCSGLAKYQQSMDRWCGCS
jgi:hypothetical protein